MMLGGPGGTDGGRRPVPATTMPHFSLKSVATALFVCLVTVAPPSLAQAPAASPDSRPTIRAARVTDGPVLDGNVLGDPVWQAIVPVSEFLQEQPNEGQPASERTEVRVAFTNATLYVGVVLYDRNPESIIVSDARRDAPLDETDSFQMVFDTLPRQAQRLRVRHEPGRHRVRRAGHQ
jgi:hypothetical protein